MTENEDLELQALTEMVRKELSNNGCPVEYSCFPYEVISDFPRRVSSSVDVYFVKDNVKCNVTIERSVFNNINKQFAFDMDAEYTLMEDQMPSLSSLNPGDKFIVVSKSPDGVTLRLRHVVSSDVVADSKTIFSDEEEIAAVAKAMVSRIIEEMNKI